MRWMRRLTWWLNRRRMADELREEMETHRALRAGALARDGAADPAAAAARALGNLPLAQDDARDVWVWPWLDGVVRDTRHALRLIVRRPGFAATCIGTIALGTAALAAVLAVVHAVLLKAPPYPNHSRIVQIGQTVKGRVFDEVSPPDVQALRARGGALQEVTTAWMSQVSLSGGALPERARMVYTDARAFSMLGTAPFLGRVPVVADEAQDTPPIVVLGHTLWTQQFAGDRDILGKPVRINGRDYSVIGVMPPEFKFPAPYWSGGDLWLMRRIDDPSLPATRDQMMLAFGLLAEGATVAHAQQAADAAAAALDAAHPAAGPIGLRLMPYADTVRASARPRLLLILGAAVLVLLIVCVNVVNLLVGHNVDRQRELAARAALGAGRGRLIRQLVTETGVLFAAGGALGLVLAVWASRAIVAVRSFSIPRMEEAVVSNAVVLMALAAIVVAALVTGGLIAWQATSASSAGFVPAARGASQGRRGRRLQRALVAAEVALALVLVCGIGVLVQGAREHARVEIGFNPDGIVHARVTLPRDRYETPQSQREVIDRIVASLASIPGVERAGAVDVPPGVGGSNARAVLLDNDPIPGTAREMRQTNVRIASTTYFETLGLQARAGRLFSPADSGDAPIAIVNQAFADAYLAGETAVGRQVRVVTRGEPPGRATLRTIVGVYPNIKERTIYHPTPPTVYLPLEARDATRMAVLIRTARPLGEMTPLIRQAVGQVDPDQAVHGTMMLGDLMRSELSLNKLTLHLVGTLGAVAVLLAVLGVYGVTAHSMRQRTREIAIRLALGSPGSAAQRLLLAEGVTVIGVAFAAGSLAAIWAAAALRAQVYGITSTSPATFLAAGTLLAATVVAGMYIPARRAARVDPATVLRAE